MLIEPKLQELPTPKFGITLPLSDTTTNPSLIQFCWTVMEKWRLGICTHKINAQAENRGPRFYFY